MRNLLARSASIAPASTTASTFRRADRRGCRHADVPVATWNVAYRKGCFLFSHEDTYHHTMLDRADAAWEHDDLGPGAGKGDHGLPHQPLTGTRDWIWFHEKPIEDVGHIARELGLDLNKPIIGLLTNVFWDAQLHYRANAFTTCSTGSSRRSATSAAVPTSNC